MNTPVKGQRWISETEPELGIGTVIDADKRQVKILFEAGETVRAYAISSAPLRRVRFHPGDTVKGRDGGEFTVHEVTEKEGLLFYHGTDEQEEGRGLAENELSAVLGAGTPRDRLLAGLTDSSKTFDLRLNALNLRRRIRKSPVRGFLGGRVELIPHQFYIADETAGRFAPRVLLSDETGLGKTIEACLILHRLLISGRIGRVLILLPDALIHQWFAELYRRFNLVFKIYDEPLCASIEEHEPDANPFMQDQQIICSLNFAVSTPKRTVQIIASDWDMLIVDEAHHLEEGKPGYELVKGVARRTERLLLLTATPEQLGISEHFARLKLLDPDRYYDEAVFMQESENYRSIASLAAAILEGRPLTRSQAGELRALLRLNNNGEAEGAKALLPDFGNPAERQKCIHMLTDRHGIGRAVFRNTRNTIKGFPIREARLAPLPSGGCKKHYLRTLAVVFKAETGGSGQASPPDFDSDPRIDWLADVLRHSGNEKFLLICRSKEKARAVHLALKEKITVNTALFHEDLSMLRRDQNAAWFSEPEGARLLICSEIGSEGRNFQFASNLVLFDLPIDPEELEQRIGRLDRIGQKSTIRIHIPYIRGSVHEVLARWYDEGLNAFRENLPGGNQVKERFAASVRQLAIEYHESGDAAKKALDALIAETVTARKSIAARLRDGRDRLLELCANHPEKAAQIIGNIQAEDRDEEIDRFMLDMFEHSGVDATPLEPRMFYLKPTLGFDEHFPEFKGDEMTVTFDRETAINKEHLTFLTWDHPMVAGVIEMITGAEIGNCALAVLEDAKKTGLWLEAVFMLECVAAPALAADRFLSPVPIRLVVDHQMANITDEADRMLPGAIIADCDAAHFPVDFQLFRDLLPVMIRSAQEIAEKQSETMIKTALKAMEKELDGEILRLQDLSQMNPAIRKEEIELAVNEKRRLEDVISGSRLRLDALRLIAAGGNRT